MSLTQSTPFQEAIEAAESLSFEDREELLETLKIRMAEERRDQIAANAREAVNAVKEKRARFGNVEDLKKDLLDNDV